MLRLLSRLLIIGLIALGFFLFVGSQFFQNAGNALISAINGSAVHGVAQVVPSTSGNSSNLQVTLQGLTPKSPYDITLDQNQCGGTVVKDVGPVTTDTGGNVTKTFTVPYVSNTTQQTYWVDVHQGSDRSSASTACGQVQLNNASASHIDVSGVSNSSSTSNNDPIGVSNTNSTPSAGGGNSNPGDPGLPNSGIAPGGSNSYDNYTFPRKY